MRSIDLFIIREKRILRKSGEFIDDPVQETVNMLIALINGLIYLKGKPGIIRQEVEEKGSVRT